MSNFDPTKPVQTRDGRAARIICADRKMALGTIVALVTNEDGSESHIITCGDTGRRSGYTLDGPFDLINIPDHVRSSGL